MMLTASQTRMVAYHDVDGEFYHPEHLPELDALVDAYYEKWQEENGNRYGAPGIYDVVERVTASEEGKEFSGFIGVSAYVIDEYEAELAWEYESTDGADGWLGEPFAVYCAQCDERILS